MTTSPKIERIGKKSLRVVNFGRLSIVYSYTTPIALYDAHREQLALGLNAYKHSVTTTKHVREIFKRFNPSHANTIRISEFDMFTLADANGFAPSWDVPYDTRGMK